MNHLHEELKKLKKDMVDMASLVNNQLNKSVKSLIRFDKNLAREVLFNEKRVNAFELKIDKDCENIFALYTPVANDLRFVFSTLKSNSNFERIGDNAEGIAKYVIESEQLINQEILEVLMIEEMANCIEKMIKTVCEAYENDNADLARSIFEMDVKINQINKNAIQLVIDLIKKDPSKTQELLYILIMIRKLERVGDLVTNIAEEIIFYVEAKILKHGAKTLRDFN